MISIRWYLGIVKGSGGVLYIQRIVILRGPPLSTSMLILGNVKFVRLVWGRLVTKP